MRKFKVYIWCLLVSNFIITNLVQANDPDTDSLKINRKIDSLFVILNHKPSNAELEWVKSNIHTATAWEQAKDFLPWLTAIVAIISFFIQRNWQLKKDRVDKLYDSLRWFEGKTQSRSVGIAMVEANWEQETDFRKIWYPVLSNQAIYLLLKSGQDDAPHEISNLKRIMTLLKHNKRDFQNKFKQGFDELALALHLRTDDGKPLIVKQNDNVKEVEDKPKEEKNKTAGLDLSRLADKDCLYKWKKNFIS